MKQAVRAIIIRDNHLLVMHRNKFGREYYTLIGGGVDVGETHEQALVREVQEESGMVITDYRLCFIEATNEMYGVQQVYWCQDPGGDPVLSPQSEEAQISKLGQNLYTPMWLALDRIQEKPFLSEALKLAIIEGVKDGFPMTPKNLPPTPNLGYTTKHPSHNYPPAAAT